MGRAPQFYNYLNIRSSRTRSKSCRPIGRITAEPLGQGCPLGPAKLKHRDIFSRQALLNSNGQPNPPRHEHLFTSDYPTSPYQGVREYDTRQRDLKASIIGD
ncbi:hypothetical protein E4U61_000839 [Claviceps capensis]|nr:hypothetical protein E4U61_000839 [Claviceps capensis]